VGRKLVTQKLEVFEIFMYKRDSASGHYELEKKFDFVFDDFTCCKFVFDVKDSNVLIFFGAAEIFKFNY